MDAQKVDMFLMSNSKFFESHQMNMIRERLVALDDSKWAMLSTIQFKDPTTSLIVSILAGGLGIDRFMIGDSGLGVAKLLTCGVLEFGQLSIGFKFKKQQEKRICRKFNNFCINVTRQEQAIYNVINSMFGRVCLALL